MGGPSEADRWLLDEGSIRGEQKEVPLAGEAVELLRLNASQPAGMVIAIQCAGPIVGTQPFDPGQDVIVAGQLRWGTGNAQGRAEFDWIQGTRLAVVAAWASVRAFYEGSVTPLDRPPFVSAWSGYMPLGTVVGPQRTRRLNTITPTVAQSVAVPPFSHRVEFLFTPSTSTFDVDYVRSDGVVVATHGTPLVAVGAQFFPIPGEVTTITIRNTGAVNITFLRIIFRLAI